MLVLCHAWIDWWDGLLARPVPLDGLEARPTRPIKARVTLH
jgi:hypothetical protein